MKDARQGERRCRTCRNPAVVGDRCAECDYNARHPEAPLPVGWACKRPRKERISDRPLKAPQEPEGYAFVDGKWVGPHERHAILAQRVATLDRELGEAREAVRLAQVVIGQCDCIMSHGGSEPDPKAAWRVARDRALSAPPSGEACGTEVRMHAESALAARPAEARSDDRGLLLIGGRSWVVPVEIEAEVERLRASVLGLEAGADELYPGDFRDQLADAICEKRSDRGTPESWDESFAAADAVLILIAARADPHEPPDALIAGLRTEVEVHRAIQKYWEADAEKRPDDHRSQMYAKGVANAHGWAAEQLDALIAKATGQES